MRDMTIGGLESRWRWHPNELKGAKWAVIGPDGMVYMAFETEDEAKRVLHDVSVRYPDSTYELAMVRP